MYFFDQAKSISAVGKLIFRAGLWLALVMALAGCMVFETPGLAAPAINLPASTLLPTASPVIPLFTPRPSATAFRPTLHKTEPFIPSPTSLLPGMLQTPTRSLAPTRTPRRLPPVEPGTSERGFSFAGLNRTYLLHIPPGYSPDEELPLLVLLHGKGNSGKVMMELSNFNLLADKMNFLVVYPNALGNPTVWNTGFNSDTRNLADDIGFFKALFSRLEEELAVDPQRIYMGGFSNGAIMTYRYAVEPDNRLAAAAAVAGTVGVYTTGYKKDFMELPAKPLPMLSIFGGDDVGIPLVGEPIPTTPLLSVTDTVQFWVQANGCRPGSQRDTSLDGKVIRDAFLGCSAGADVVSYILTDTGHVWPEPTRDKLSATAAMWEFLSRYSLAP